MGTQARETALQAFLGVRPDEEYRAWLESRSPTQAAAEVGCSPKTVENWEKIYGARCGRECRDCGQFFTLEEMHKDGSGRLSSMLICEKCFEDRDHMPRYIRKTKVPLMNTEWTHCLPMMADAKIKMTEIDDWNGYKGQHGRIDYGV